MQLSWKSGEVLLEAETEEEAIKWSYHFENVLRNFLQQMHKRYILLAKAAHNDAPQIWCSPLGYLCGCCCYFGFCCWMCAVHKECCGFHSKCRKKRWWYPLINTV